MSLVGQVDWYFHVTVCARETCGIATVAVAAAPAARAPDFKNFRREKDCASLLIWGLLLLPQLLLRIFVGPLVYHGLDRGRNAPSGANFCRAIARARRRRARAGRGALAATAPRPTLPASTGNAVISTVLRPRNQHPAHAEAIRHHAKALGKERLGQRQLRLSALGKGRKEAYRIGFILGIERERKSLELGLHLRAAVRHHHRHAADLDTGMHDLVLAAGRAHVAIRTILEAHQHLHLGAERLFVELDCLFAATVEKQ